MQHAPSVSFFFRHRDAFVSHLRSVQDQIEATDAALSPDARESLILDRLSIDRRNHYQTTRQQLSLPEIIDWIETLTPEDFTDERSYSIMRQKLDLIYSVDLMDVFALPTQNERYNALAGKKGQLEKWKFITAIRNLRGELELDEDGIDLHAALSYQLALHERGVDSIHMGKDRRLRHNPAIHSQYVDDMFDRVFKVALLLEDLNPDSIAFVPQMKGNALGERVECDVSAQMTFTEALDVYTNRYAAKHGAQAAATERQRVLEMRRELSLQALVHDMGELQGEFSQASKRNMMSAAEVSAHEHQVEEYEHRAFTAELEWHVIQLAKLKSGVIDASAYQALLHEHGRAIHDVYLASRASDRTKRVADDRAPQYPTPQKPLSDYTATFDAHKTVTGQPPQNRAYDEAYRRIAGLAQQIVASPYQNFNQIPFFHALVKAVEHVQSHKDYMGHRVETPNPNGDFMTMREFVEAVSTPPVHYVREEVLSRSKSGDVTYRVSRAIRAEREYDDPKKGRIRRNVPQLEPVEGTLTVHANGSVTLPDGRTVESSAIVIPHDKHGAPSQTSLIVRGDSGTRRGAFPLYVIDDPMYGHFKFKYFFGEMEKMPQDLAAGSFEERLSAAALIYGAQSVKKYNRPETFLPTRYPFERSRAERWGIRYEEGLDPQYERAFPFSANGRGPEYAGKPVVMVSSQVVGEQSERIARERLEQFQQGPSALPKR